ncbi:MAG: branched-chain amino acid ABC transporter permease [Actinomycetota bacterium]
MKRRGLASRLPAILKDPLMLMAIAVVAVGMFAAFSPLPGLRIFTDALRSATGGQAAVFALAAIGLNIHFGYTGLLNFGHVGFLLVGAYGTAATVSTFGGSLWLGILIGMGLSVVLALIMGGTAVRLRADYLAIVTIAVAEILRFLARSRAATDVTGGVFGLQGFADAFYDINPIPRGIYALGWLQFTERRLWPIVAGWGLVVLVSIVVWLLMRSPWGRVLRAVREDEDAARALGKNAFGYKLQSLMLGGVIGGLAGSLWAIHLQAVTPDQFLPIQTFFVYAVLILGGPGTVAGPVVGSVIFWFVVAGFDSFLRAAAFAGYIPDFLGATEAVGAARFVLVGAGLMALMIFRPQGLLGNKREMQIVAS